MRYQPFYCEENVWWLAQEPRFEGLGREVVFVSNERGACAMFHQRAAKSALVPVVWDYHVILAVHAPSGVEVWDLDCAGGAPLAGADWLRLSFSARLPSMFAPLFRVLPADEFVRTFSSDRGHMRAKDGTFRAPPPPWPCILAGEPNLDRFARMDEATDEVIDLRTLERRWSTG